MSAALFNFVRFCCGMVLAVMAFEQKRPWWQRGCAAYLSAFMLLESMLKALLP